MGPQFKKYYHRAMHPTNFLLVSNIRQRAVDDFVYRTYQSNFLVIIVYSIS